MKRTVLLFLTMYCCSIYLFSKNLCISEVLANDFHSNEGPGEFVELYNLSESSIELKGLIVASEGEKNDTIVDYIGAFDLGQCGTVIFPKSFALIVDPDYDGCFNEYIENNADLSKLIIVTISQDSSLGAGGLKNTSGSVWITSGSVVLSSFTWLSNPGDGVSWEKVDVFAACENYSSSDNWLASVEQMKIKSHCTPGYLNSVSKDFIAPGQITHFVTRSGNTIGEIIVNWVVPGDDGYNKKDFLGRYEILYATFNPILIENMRCDYQIEENIFWGIKFIDKKKKPTETEEYVFDDLLAGETYFFAIRTVDDEDNFSDYDVYLCAGEPVFGVAYDTEPDKIKDLQVKTSHKKIMLSWAKNKQRNIQKYEVYYVSGNGFTKLSDVEPNQCSFVHNVDRNGLYCYRICVLSFKNKKSEFSQIEARCCISKPVNVIAKHLLSKVELNWNLENCEEIKDVKEYLIYRSEMLQDNYELVGRTNDNNFLDCYDVRPVSYYYKLKAVDMDNIEGLFSDEVIIVPQVNKSSKKNIFVTPYNPNVYFENLKKLKVLDYFGNIVFLKETQSNYLLWDGCSNNGYKLESGAYIYEILRSDNNNNEYGVIIIVR